MSVQKSPVLILCLLVATACAASAATSLGIGNNEVSTIPTGMFAGLFHWINSQQKEFYRAMTGALKAMRDDGAMPWPLIGLSFAYGVLHAAGPGHGKAVIASYMVANETALKRGILLSFVSAFLQAFSAIVIIGIAFLVLRGTSYKLSDATQIFEIASFAAIAGFGAWLLWSKIFQTNRSAAHAVHNHNQHDHAHHAPTRAPVCDTCGHSHAPDPQAVTKNFNWKTASAAVFAVGLRPCSGALIVLTFALLNGLYLGGVLSVLAMAFGTALTVSAFATVAVTAKNLALKYTNATSSNTISRWIEIGGAALVLILGLSLLGASLSA